MATRLFMWVVGAVVLAACAAAAPPAPGIQFDGSYIGQDTLVTGVPFQCGDPVLLQRFEVRGGQFYYPFQVSPPRAAPLPVWVRTDGSLAGQMQYGVETGLPFRQSFTTEWATLAGHITDGTLDATVTGFRCVRRLTATAQRLG